MLDGRLPPGFERKTVVMRPGDRRTYRPPEWQDAIVTIVSGEILLERAGQAPGRFGPGDLVCLAGLGLTAISNPGPARAVLIAVRRRPQQPTETT
jgi:hypothetical protein